MPDTNQALFDAANRHQVYVQRYGARIANETIGILNRAESDLVGQIFTRMERITARGRDRGPATTRRLQELLRQLREINDDIHDEMLGFVREELRSFAENEAQLAVRRLGEATSTGFGYIAPSRATLHNIVVSRPFEGQLLRGWFNQLNRQQQGGIERAIRQGLLQSETTDQIVRRIIGTRSLNFRDGILDRSRRNVRGVVRTATNFVSNESREETYRENGDIILAVRWTSTLDGRTSPICRARDGKLAPIGDTSAAEINRIGELLDPPGARPPAHINCRSTTTPITRSWAEIERLKGTEEFRQNFESRLRQQGFTDAQIRQIRANTRASMDGQVPSGLTYQEWLNRQPPEFQNDVLGPTRAQLFRDGNLNLDHFVDESGETLTLDQLRSRERETWNSVFPDRRLPADEEEFSIITDPDVYQELGLNRRDVLTPVQQRNASRAARFYQSDAGYSEINGYLRGNRRNIRDRRYIKAMDDFTNNYELDRNVRLYRGVNDTSKLGIDIDHADDYIGIDLSDPGYMSTTVEPDAARIFTDFSDRGALFEIRAREGTRFGHMASAADADITEFEVVLPRNTRMRITGVRRETIEFGDEVSQVTFEAELIGD